MHLPGSLAPTVQVQALLNSLPRWVLKSNGALRGFLRSILSVPRRAIAPSTPSSSSTIWPMPLPYPEVFSKGAVATSAPDHFDVKRSVCMQVVCFDWLILGCPRGAPKFLAIGTKLSGRQWSAVKYLEHLMLDANSPLVVDAALLGRAASKFESLDESLAALSRAAAFLVEEEKNYFPSTLSVPDDVDESYEAMIGAVVGELKGRSDLAAKPLVAERLVFPGPPQFNPAAFLDPSTLDLYEHPIAFGASPGSVSVPVPRVRVFASHGEKLALYRKLADSGRLQPVEVKHKRGDHVSGLFGVPKDQHRDRMVLDGRPANLLDGQQNVWCKSMASASVLGSIFLKEDSVLLASGEDLRDYFYQFAAGPERTVRNILSDPIPLHDARKVFGPHFTWSEDPVWVGLSSLAMGDSLACEFAQGSHIGLVLQHEVAHVSELLTLKQPLPRGLLHVGVIIDDLVILEQCLRQEWDAIRNGMASKADARMDRAVQGYSEAKLETNPKKAFRNMEMSKFWGIEIDGVKGILRGSSSRLWATVFITMRVAMLGLATVSLLECLAGCWISLITVRRRMLCLMEVIFGALSAGNQRAIIRLSPELIDELLMLAILAPLACTDLRAPAKEFLVSTDASLGAMAAVNARIGSALSKELCRTSLSKGRWTALLSPAASWERGHELLAVTDEIDEPYAVHPLWELCARSLNFSEQWRELVKPGKHINILELKAHLREERRLCVHQQRARVPFALDSQVCLGALVKGRSASRALNSCLKQSLAYPISCGIFGHYTFVPSSYNRADGPTRDSDPAPPDMEAPEWLGADDPVFSTGLDKWLADIGCPAVVELPFEQLMHGMGSVDIRSRSQLSCQERLDERCLQTFEPGNNVAVSSETSVMTDNVVCAREDDDVPLLCMEPSALLGGSNFAELAVPPVQTLHSEDRFAALFNRFCRRQFVTKPGVALLHEPGGLDLYSGNFGVAKHMVLNGAPWVLTFDIKRSQTEDLLDPTLRDDIIHFFELGCFASLGLAPICASFSRAITPPVRSRRWPRGIPSIVGPMVQKLKDGNSHAAFCLALISLALAMDIAFWCENPDKSFLWIQRGWEAYVKPSSQHVFRLSYCRFGTKWRKDTRVATNTLLAGLRMLCKCGGLKHQVLRGYSVAHKKSWTALAEPYPRGFARMLALSLCIKAGWASQTRLNVSGCARCGSLRIGEATNPGPQRFREPRSSLHELHTLTPGTMALESRILRGFLQWCSSEIRDCNLEELFDSAPQILVFLIQTFGDLMFQQRKSLSSYRHLLLAIQRWRPLTKPFMQPAWDFVSRWELQEPVEHRTPIPETLLRSMVVLAWLYRWYGWCAATLIAFYGGGRLGEILQSERQDLLLPGDLLEPGVSPVFLRLRKFKSRTRQSARVQHLRIDEPVACKLLAIVLRQLQPDDPLFKSTAYQYRKRWDILVSALSIPATARLTPGGLRGGFAVWAYRSGKQIQDIMWALRLRSQTTLESYLQETAALNCLASLPRDARDEIISISQFFSFLPAAA